jgi:hypothetical protein
MYGAADRRWLSKDPIKDGLNWYTYCNNNPIVFIDPWGLSPVDLVEYAIAMGASTEYFTNSNGSSCVKITANGRTQEYVINSGWIEDYKINPVFGWGVNDTEKIINDIYVRVYALSNQVEKNRLIEIATNAKAMQKAGTPYMFGQEKVMNQLHSNVNYALNQDFYKWWWWLLCIGDTSTPYMDSYAWFVKMACSDWDYKWNSDWQVPYDTFNEVKMDTKQKDGGYPKNWTPWIYFDGMLMGADKFGNLNLGYVGYHMGFDGIMLLNFATSGAGDGFWVQYGINMAKGGR